MELKDIKAVYFVGAGGIGMSAIARYFINRGMVIHYDENVDEIPQACRDKASCLVVYTPAIPATHKELCYFRENGFEIQKRAQVLGTLTRTHKGLCVAGTHGKTTTSTMCAHIMHQSHVDCNAFLGGISKNYGTNYILSDHSDYVVIEADEFHAENIIIENGEITFDFVSPVECIKGVRLGQPVPINIENGVGAMAMAQLNGCTAEELKYGMKTYHGVDRRFDFKLRNARQVLCTADSPHHRRQEITTETLDLSCASTGRKHCC